MSMNQAKQLSLYVVGLFSLSLGVSFSIQANLGVSPVSSLPYALTLSSEATIAITTIIVNVIFIFIQMLLYRKSKLRDYLKQIPIVLLFGFFLCILRWNCYNCLQRQWVCWQERVIWSLA